MLAVSQPTSLSSAVLRSENMSPAAATPRRRLKLQPRNVEAAENSAPQPSKADASPDLWQTIDVVHVEPVTWLVDDVIPDKALICLYGAPNCGKTFLALHIALSLIMGIECFPDEAVDATGPARKASVPGPPSPIPEAPVRSVIYMLSEAPDSIGRRIAGWLEHFGYDREKAQPVISKGLLAASNTNRIKLNSPSHRAEFVERVKKVKIDPSLIIFDPLISALEGDENDANQMDRFVMGMDALRQEFACSVMVIHHPGKDARMIERGSSALRGGVDTHIAVHNDMDLIAPMGQPAVHRVRLDIEKQREAPRTPVRYLAMHPARGRSDARDRDSLEIELGRAPSPSHAPTAEETIAARRSRSPRQDARNRGNSQHVLKVMPSRDRERRPLISNRAYHEALRACQAAKKAPDGSFTKASALRAHSDRARRKGKSPYSEGYFYKVMERVIESEKVTYDKDNRNALYLIKAASDSNGAVPDSGRETTTARETRSTP